MTEASAPPIVHVTHWKAGSQWLHKILHWCAPDRVISPEATATRYLPAQLQRGRIYATAYVTREEFEEPSRPDDTRYFVMLRDLRDTLVSLYFSARDSHPMTTPKLVELRARLKSLSQEDGLLFMAEHETLEKCAEIQRSWLAAGIPILRYEDLLTDDEAMLQQILLSHCGLGVSQQHLVNAVRGCRFRTLTGRPPGEEHTGAHERKGISGDWQNYMTDRLAQVLAKHDETLQAYWRAPGFPVRA